jgi:hypothetical protein
MSPRNPSPWSRPPWPRPGPWSGPPGPLPATPVSRAAPLAWFGGALMLGITMWATGIFAVVRAVQAMVG